MYVQDRAGVDRLLCTQWLRPRTGFSALVRKAEPTKGSLGRPANKDGSEPTKGSLGRIVI